MQHTFILMCMYILYYIYYTLRVYIYTPVYVYVCVYIYIMDCYIFISIHYKIYKYIYCIYIHRCIYYIHISWYTGIFSTKGYEPPAHQMVDFSDFFCAAVPMVPRQQCGKRQPPGIPKMAPGIPKTMGCFK